MANRTARLGIDLGGTKIEAIVLEPDGTAALRKRIPTPRGSYQGIIDALGSLVVAVDDQYGRIGRVGVGIPGVVSSTTGLVKNANSTELIGHPLDRDLERLLTREVRIANDANCFALSEAVDGAASAPSVGTEAPVVFGVILGTGTGGGLVIDGRLHEGCDGIAGEWGHNPLPWMDETEAPGPTCWCGLRGCIETFLSGSGLSRAYAEFSETPLEAAEIARQASGGEEVSLKALRRYESRLARALASVINLVNPDAIVLGGGLSNIEALYERVPQIWKQFVFSDSVSTRLVRAKHGDSSGVRGAAWLWPLEAASARC